MNLLQIGKSIEEKYEERKTFLKNYKDIDQDIIFSQMLLTTGINGKTNKEYFCYSDKLGNFERLFDENELLIITPAYNYSFVKKYIFNIDNNHLLLITINDIRQINSSVSALNKDEYICSRIIPIDNSYLTVNKLPYYSIIDLFYSEKEYDIKCKTPRTNIEDGKFLIRDLLVPLSLEEIIERIIKKDKYLGQSQLTKKLK